MTVTCAVHWLLRGTWCEALYPGQYAIWKVCHPAPVMSGARTVDGRWDRQISVIRRWKEQLTSTDICFFFHSLYMCVNCRDAFCQCGSITHLLAEAGCVRSSVRRRRKNYDALTWRRWRCRRKKTKSRQTFNKNSCDLLTAITHTKILLAYFIISDKTSAQQ